MQNVRFFLFSMCWIISFNCLANNVFELSNSKLVKLDLPAEYTHIKQMSTKDFTVLVKGKDMTAPTKIIIKAGQIDDDKIKKNNISLCDNSDRQCIKKFGQAMTASIENFSYEDVITINNANWYKIEYENEAVIATFLLLINQKDTIMIMFNTPKYTGKEAEMRTLHQEIANDLYSGIQVDLSI